ncbi:hypothetical protein P3W85_00495 [Cupriavidus basilensis]|uniref:Uncharacterized protein n=1 Tax=Cupriavidus basilensis TaxID=68895 RepID=A0ABT6AGI8_9BURK|nr:hypothetical protein [Cupriavidus basilensis]MDF3831447.1 hypothetical protein [Cupriavidus basilensis]
MNKITLTIGKVVLSLPIAYGLAYPFLYPTAGGGVLGEKEMLGTTGSAVVALVFLMLVLLYANDLKTTLTLVHRESRAAEPSSVWLMFLLPYNFIEDFFIISNVAKSLESEARISPALAKLKSFGRASGFGWCLAQVISLTPNSAGSVAGIAAIVLWIWHWIFVRRTNSVLKWSKTSTTAPA